MGRQPNRPKPLAGRVFRASDVIALNLISKESLRSTAWRRLFRNVYADATVVDSHRIRCLAADAFLTPSGAAIAGRSAATIYGAGLSQVTDPIEVIVPASLRFGPVRGLLIHSAADLREDEIRWIARAAVTDPVRTCWDLAQWLDVVEAVVLVDRMLGQRVVAAKSLARYADLRLTERGAVRFATVRRLADPRSESPQESRLRVRLVLAGLPRPVAQFEVFSGGAFLARVDLAWPEMKIAIEYDGRWHVGSVAQLERDRRRLNRLVAAGWIVLHVTAARMRDDFPGIVSELRAAIRSRSRRASHQQG
jgi:hypothetical protein